MEQPSPRSRFGLARGDPTKILDSRLLFLARLVILGLQVTVTVFIALRDNTVWVSLSFIANVAQLAAAAVSTLATLVSAVTGVDGATARHLRAVAGPAVLVTGALSTTAALALAVLAERASYTAVETLGAPVAAKLAAATRARLRLAAVRHRRRFRRIRSLLRHRESVSAPLQRGLPVPPLRQPPRPGRRGEVRRPRRRSRRVRHRHLRGRRDGFLDTPVRCGEPRTDDRGRCRGGGWAAAVARTRGPTGRFESGAECAAGGEIEGGVRRAAAG